MKYITIYAACAALALASLTNSCSKTPEWVNETTLTTAIAVGTKAGLTLVKNDENRTRAADYISVGASALRAIAVAPTPQGLTELINSYIPENVKTDYPEVIGFVVPIVVSQYKSFYDQYSGNNEKLIKILGDIANGLDAGAACCITKK